MRIIALVWATAFRDIFYTIRSYPKVIFTDLLNIRLPLILHRTPIIHPVAYRLSLENTHSSIRPSDM